MSLDRLRSVRCYLLDMDGTFYLGERLIDGALDFVDLLRSQGKDFLFLTNNSSKDSAQYADKITRLGLPIEPGRVLTSGAATARHLQKLYPEAAAYVVGTPALEAEFARHGFRLAEDGAEVVVLGFDTGLTYAKLHRLCDLVRAGLPFVATHPDYNCPTESGFMPDIGATIAFVEASTGRRPDLIVGKPNRLMAEAAADRAGVRLESLCMVGDRLYTDVALGAAAGIPSVLVLSGEGREADLAASPHKPDFVFADLKALAEALRTINGSVEQAGPPPGN